VLYLSTRLQATNFVSQGNMWCEPGTFKLQPRASTILLVRLLPDSLQRLSTTLNVGELSHTWCDYVMWHITLQQRRKSLIRLFLECRADKEFNFLLHRFGWNVLRQRFKSSISVFYGDNAAWHNILINYGITQKTPHSKRKGRQQECHMELMQNASFSVHIFVSRCSS
jgi:hypothetical protein